MRRPLFGSRRSRSRVACVLRFMRLAAATEPLLGCLEPHSRASFVTRVASSHGRGSAPRVSLHTCHAPQPPWASGQRGPGLGPGGRLGTGVRQDAPSVVEGGGEPLGHEARWGDGMPVTPGVTGIFSKKVLSDMRKAHAELPDDRYGMPARSRPTAPPLCVRGDFPPYPREKHGPERRVAAR